MRPPREEAHGLYRIVLLCVGDVHSPGCDALTTAIENARAEGMFEALRELFLLKPTDDDEAAVRRATATLGISESEIRVKLAKLIG